MTSVSKVLQYTKQAVDTFSPEDSNSTRLTFRKFNGDSLAKLASEGTKLKKEDIITVTLLVDPEAISFVQPRITQKVATNSNRRFVIFDWGVDLLSMTISGNTGTLLPDSVTKAYDTSQLEFLTNVTRKFNDNPVSDFISNSITNFLNYEEIIALSPKYQKFVQLQNMYKEFDGDKDILTLELGINVYRGFFTNFSFDLTAASLWNYKYKIEFIALDNLTSSSSSAKGKPNPNNVEPTPTE